MSQAKLKVLMVHNRYRQPGGEDVVMDSEAAMLRERGHEVLEYRRSNEELGNAPLSLFWAREAYRDICRIIAEHRPGIAHFHNTFMAVSPSGYYACRRMGVPVVQTIHNPRLLCPAAVLRRDGRACTDCRSGYWYLPGIVRRCYRGSGVLTSAVAAMLTVHEALGTWTDKVDAYIASTGFYMGLLERYGIPRRKIYLKSHFVHPDPGLRDSGPGEFALFAGRLAPEKGVRTMMKAWRRLEGIPLKVRGEGLLLDELRREIADSGTGAVELAGRMTRDELARFMKRARFLVWPSEGYYESFGLVAVEAFASGVPVLASRTGVMEELVTDGVTGIHFNPGDPDDLAAKARWAWEHPDEMTRMGLNARAEYERKYTAETNYGLLMDIYGKTIAASRTGRT